MIPEESSRMQSGYGKWNGYRRGAGESRNLHRCLCADDIHCREAGMMDEMMGRIADECEEEVDEKLSSMIAVLEPTLVIILSVIVGTILLSVMLPLLGIMSGL